MDLEEIRTFVRNHMDLDIEDLPNALLDTFAREATRKVERAEKRWPMYESDWSYTTVAATSDITVTDLNETDNAVREIDAVYTDDGILRWLGPDEARQGFHGSTSTGKPVAWSQRAGVITLYPIPDTEYELTLTGYRKPNDWVTTGSGGEPDCDDDLHLTVATWVLSRAYAQQEDMELAVYFGEAFDMELEAFRRRIVDTPPAQPMILGRGRTNGLTFGRQRYDWEV